MRFLILLLLSTSIFSTAQTSSNLSGFNERSVEIIKENPFTIKELKSAIHYNYKGFSKKLDSEINLSYGVQNSNFLKGKLMLKGTDFILIGKYEGEGYYSSVIYNFYREIKGTLSWTFQLDPKVITLEITDKNNSIILDLNMVE